MFAAATCRRHHRTSPNQAAPHLGQILPVQRRHRLYQALVPTRTRAERTAANAVLSSCGCLKSADPRRELGSQFPIGDAHVVLGLQVQPEPRLKPACIVPSSGWLSACRICTFRRFSYRQQLILAFSVVAAP